MSMIIAAALGGCASRGHRSDERAQSYPENYKAELLQFLHSYVNDPTQIREAEIADPALMPISAIVDSGGGVDSAGGSRGSGGRGGRGRGGSGEGGGLFGGGGANPFQSQVTRQHYVVCVRYNAKDRDGRYAGITQGMAIYAGGRLDGFREQPHGACDQAEFKPFPELEKLGR